MSLFFIVLVTILVGIIVRNTLNRFTRSSHRLPPGPKPWPIIGNLLLLDGSSPHRTLQALAHVYGPIMHLRLGVNDVIVVSSASLASQFLKTHEVNFTNRPPNSGAKYIAYNYHDLVFAPYGPRWRMLKKISSVHIFSGKALDDYRHVRQDEMAILTLALASADSKAVQLGELLNACIANVLGRTMIGRKVFNDSRMGVSDPKADEFKSMVVELMLLAGAFDVSDFIPALEWLDVTGVIGKMKKLHKRFDSFFSEILEEHKRYVSGKCSDMLSNLLLLKEADEAENAGGKLTDTEIKALILNMFAAGTHTSYSVIEWIIAELIRHPKIMEQAQQELDTVVGRDRLVTELDLCHLPYLQAIVKEALRLHPSTPLSLPRMALESCEINGFHIPKGSTLLVHIYAIGRDPKQWVDPLQFKPERFLQGGEKAHVNVMGNHFELIPFGAGRRMCAGTSLGWRLVQILTATLLHGFNWDLPAGLNPKELNMDEEYGLALQKAKPLLVHPVPRLPTHLYSQSCQATLPLSH